MLAFLARSSTHQDDDDAPDDRTKIKIKNAFSAKKKLARRSLQIKT